MKGFTKHERRWTSDSVPAGIGKAISTGSSPGNESVTSSSTSAEEFVEVTLDLQDDDTIVVRSVEPATVINIDNDGGHVSGTFTAVGGGGFETPPVSGSTSVSRSPTMKRSSSNRILQFSQELKAEAVAKAKQFSQELKAELRRFSWSHSHGSRTFSSIASMVGVGGGNSGGLESALAARAMRRQRAQLDRTRSGAQKALRGLKFISNCKTNGVDAWNEVLNNFNRLAKDGYLHRADFAQCIG